MTKQALLRNLGHTFESLKMHSEVALHETRKVSRGLALEVDTAVSATAMSSNSKSPLVYPKLSSPALQERQITSDLAN